MRPAVAFDRVQKRWWRAKHGGWTRATILQFTSHGKVSGYPRRIDINAFRGTTAELAAPAGTGVAPIIPDDPDDGTPDDGAQDDIAPDELARGSSAAPSDRGVDDVQGRSTPPRSATGLSWTTSACIGCGTGPVRVREGHRSVVAEHDVEGVVPERHRLGACIQQREVDAGFGHQPPSMVELAGREVEAERSGAGSRQGDGPLCRAAPELQDVLARDVAQHLQLRLWDLGGSQARPPLSASWPPCFAWYSSLKASHEARFRAASGVRPEMSVPSCLIAAS